MNETFKRIERKEEVEKYIQDLHYALDHGAQITFQVKRLVDTQRAKKYTNQYTVNTLFPDENPVAAIKRELKTLTVQNYIGTVKDLRFPNKSEMREFGKIYNNTEEVYIKIRVELLGAYGTTAFVMSFHFAEKAFTQDMFPYKNS